MAQTTDFHRIRSETQARNLRLTDAQLYKEWLKRCNISKFKEILREEYKIDSCHLDECKHDAILAEIGKYATDMNKLKAIRQKYKANIRAKDALLLKIHLKRVFKQLEAKKNE